MMSKVWKFNKIDEQILRRICDDFGMPEPLARVLAARGFANADCLESFLNPCLRKLGDPFLLSGMELTVERIWHALDHKETIAVFGDYDVDGITATALLTRILKTLGGIIKPFIPNRLDEGYGLSPDALERCITECRPSLIITVDCGTNSVESVATAQKKGIGVIVTDHHQPAERIAEGLAVINPKLEDQSNLKDLAGVGVAFKLAHALLKYGRRNGRIEAQSVELRDYLDLVALGTVADMVPLLGENRIFVRYGLAQLHQTRWPGLAALKLVSRIQESPETWHLGYVLGPRINAAGRIGDPVQALRLLTTDDQQEAEKIARELDTINRERQDIEKAITNEAIEKIDAYFDSATHYGLVVDGEGWNPGVVGIVASRICHRYYRPTIVLGIDADHRARGSCRSIEEYDILEGLRACSTHLIKYGGHKLAAGVELLQEDIEAFRQAFNAATARCLAGLDLSPMQPIDACLSPGAITRSLIDGLKKLQPFGQGNPEPVWALRNVKVQGVPRVLGEQHLKFSVEAGNSIFEVIAFNFSQDKLPDGALDIAFVLKENTWNGKTSLQLQLKDVRPACTE